MSLYRATLSYLQNGGLIMLPLVGVSIIMWTVILERTVALKRLDRGGTSTAAMLGRLENREEPVAGTGIEEVLLEAFRSSRTGNLKLDCALLDQHALVIGKDLSRGLGIIAIMAAIAPLLGLLGTVSGMMDTFNVISLFGTGNAKGMADGISIALITTQAGLVIAIPGLYMSVYLRRHAHRLENKLNENILIIKRHIRSLP